MRRGEKKICILIDIPEREREVQRLLIAVYSAQTGFSDENE